jgi:tRNA-dihydrouridine synthase A
MQAIETQSVESGLRGVTRAISVAPMMARTDRHYRVFMRALTRETLLYTEMVTTGALIHGDQDRHLGFSEGEHPLAIQLGGDEPEALAVCARIAEERGYDEVNLNIGCPSDRVQNGSFGACLMARPERVAEGVQAMREAVSIPVTVKHRIGIDDLDRYDDMARFVSIVSEVGCDRFSVHARKAWLQGLSPRENRTVPPLRYGDVYRLKREFPALVIEINGGIGDMDSAADHLVHVDAVMIGRAAYDDPWCFHAVDQRFFGSDWAPESRHAVVESLFPYVEEILAKGERLHVLGRHLHHLFTGCPGSRAWKRHLSEAGMAPEADLGVLQAGLALVPRDLPG